MGRKRKKCKYCKVELKITSEDCCFCGGGEMLECPDCLAVYDIETGEEL